MNTLRDYVRRRQLARRWRLIGDFVRLVAISSRVKNLEAPINVCLVGPPGDGKTAMLMRAAALPHVRVFSDVSPKGLLNFLDLVHDGFVSCLIVPDLGSVIGRKLEVGRQVIANLAMMCGEGVYQVAVYGRQKDFEGARAGLMTAVTTTNFMQARQTLEQNGFLSRLFLVDFDFRAHELLHMEARKLSGERGLLAPFRYPHAPRRRGVYLQRSVRVSKTHAARVLDWWQRVMAEAPAHLHGFRTADALTGLLQASAYLHGRPAVTRADVDYIARFEPLWLTQFTPQEG